MNNVSHLLYVQIPNHYDVHLYCVCDISILNYTREYLVIDSLTVCIVSSGSILIEEYQ